MNTFIHADLDSIRFFMGVVVLVVSLIILGAFWVEAKFSLKITAFLFVWIALTSAVVGSGFLLENEFPHIPLFFALNFICAFAFGFSGWGRHFTEIPLWCLAGFQGFRYPLEMVLHSWAGRGTVPETMTWTGQNFDIFTGVLALLVLLPPFRNKKLIWVVNVVGIILLMNVIRVAILSSPLPIAWELERPLRLIQYLPYALIGTVCVWSALVGHVVLTRALLKKNS